jgi:hypothetical protein
MNHRKDSVRPPNAEIRTIKTIEIQEEADYWISNSQKRHPERSPVSRDKSVRRFAQDDDFVASWTKDPNKVARMGVVLGNFIRPCVTEAGKCEFSRRL